MISFNPNVLLKLSPYHTRLHHCKCSCSAEMMISLISCSEHMLIWFPCLQFVYNPAATPVKSGAHPCTTFLIPQGLPVRSVVTNAFSKKPAISSLPLYVGFLKNAILVLAGINMLISIKAFFFVFFFTLAIGPGERPHGRIDMQQS